MKRVRPRLAWLAWLVPLVVWAALAVVLAYRHELWRDEVRPLNLVAFSKTPWAILDNLRNEGHPPLWYLVLWLGTLGGRFYWMLKPIALAVGAGSAYLFVRHAPLPPWLRPLFLFGLFPLYELTVMCRNYGLSLLLLLAIARWWPRRFSHPLGLALWLSLLANTNAHSLLVTLALTLALLLERLRGGWPKGDRPRELLALTLVLAASWLSVLVMRPDSDVSVLKHSLRLDELHLVRWSRWFLRDPLRVCPELLGVTLKDTRNFAAPLDLPRRILGAGWFLLMLGWLWRRAWPLAVACGVGLWSLSVFGDLVYSLMPRHHAVAYAFVVALWWMAAAGAPANQLARLIVAALLVVQLRAAWEPASADYRLALSAAPAFGEYLRARPQLAQAVVIADPETPAETLPYYVPGVQIQLAHEGRYLQGRVVWTAENRPQISVDELLDTAQREARARGRPVLLLLGSDGGSDPFGGLEKRLIVREASRSRFLGATRPLRRFQSDLGDESYTLYQLRR